MVDAMTTPTRPSSTPPKSQPKEQTVSEQPRNYLDIGRTMKLVEYLKANKQHIENSGRTYADIAQAAGATLGFRVTVPNVNSCLDALKISPGRGRGGTPHPDEVKTALLLLARELHEFRPTSGTAEALRLLDGYAGQGQFLLK